MAVPLLSKKIVKKRVKKFKRPQSDRKISVKVFDQRTHSIFSYDINVLLILFESS